MKSSNRFSTDWSSSGDDPVLPGKKVEIFHFNQVEKERERSLPYTRG